MSRVTELEKALTTLFRKGTEVGYTETEIDEFLENIDYHALLQAVWNKAETVYAYRADGKNALSLDYQSAELFKQRATLLYEDVGDSYIGAVFLVLWTFFPVTSSATVTMACHFPLFFLTLPTPHMRKVLLLHFSFCMSAPKSAVD